MPLRTRIAPTPSGFLHRGNALAFLHTARRARGLGALLLLRIDDMDRERVRPEYVQDVFDTLRFLRIEPDEGPRDAADVEASWSQRLRVPLYDEALARLVELHAVYACICSRSQLAASGVTGCPGGCREKAIPLDTEGAAWRVRTDDKTKLSMRGPEGIEMLSLPAALRDFIVRKKDGFPSYQLCSLVDDVHFGVDYIVRGLDLWDSTLAQLYLARELGYASFAACTFEHHPVLTDRAGNKLSKSAGAASVKHFREHGGTLEDFIKNTGTSFYP